MLYVVVNTQASTCKADRGAVVDHTVHVPSFKYSAESHAMRRLLPGTFPPANPGVGLESVQTPKQQQTVAPRMFPQHDPLVSTFPLGQGQPARANPCQHRSFRVFLQPQNDTPVTLSQCYLSEPLPQRCASSPPGCKSEAKVRPPLTNEEAPPGA